MPKSLLFLILIVIGGCCLGFPWPTALFACGGGGSPPALVTKPLNGYVCVYGGLAAPAKPPEAAGVDSSSLGSEASAVTPDLPAEYDYVDIYRQNDSVEIWIGSSFYSFEVNTERKYLAIVEDPAADIKNLMLCPPSSPPFLGNLPGPLCGEVPHPSTPAAGLSARAVTKTPLTPPAASFFGWLWEALRNIFFPAQIAPQIAQVGNQEETGGSEYGSENVLAELPPAHSAEALGSGTGSGSGTATGSDGTSGEELAPVNAKNVKISQNPQNDKYVIEGDVADAKVKKGAVVDTLDLSRKMLESENVIYTRFLANGQVNPLTKTFQVEIEPSRTLDGSVVGLVQRTQNPAGKVKLSPPVLCQIVSASEIVCDENVKIPKSADPHASGNGNGQGNGNTKSNNPSSQQK
jgi:hypothetical protein